MINQFKKILKTPSEKIHAKFDRNLLIASLKINIDLPIKTWPKSSKKTKKK
jgi:hypothetical protein